MSESRTLCMNARGEQVKIKRTIIYFLSSVRKIPTIHHTDMMKMMKLVFLTLKENYTVCLKDPCLRVREKLQC